MTDLDELGMTIAENILSVIEENTDILLATDEEILKLTEDLTQLVLDKYSEVHEDKEYDDTIEYYGDMDEFPGEG